MKPWGAGRPKMGLSSVVEELAEALSPGHANTPQVIRQEKRLPQKLPETDCEHLASRTNRKTMSVTVPRLQQFQLTYSAQMP